MASVLDGGRASYLAVEAVVSMAQAFKRIGVWLQHRFGKRSVAGLGVLFGLWLLEQVTGQWVSDTALPFVVAHVGALLARPVGFFGVLLVGLFGVLIIIAFVETSPFVGWLKELRGRRRPPVLDASAHAQERAEMQGEIEGLQRLLRQHNERWNFGEELYEFTPQSDVQREEVVSRVAELLPTARTLMHWCDQAWREVRPADGSGGTDRALAELAPLAEEKFRHPLFAVFQVWNDAIQMRRDPRPYLVCFHKRYREWRDWVLKISDFNRIRDVRSAPSYAEWWRYDGKWREELVQKLAAPNLMYVRKVLTDYNQEHGDFVAMPQPVPPPDVRS